MPLPVLLRRLPALLAAAALAGASGAANAQLFWQPPDLSTPPLGAEEAQALVKLPGATPAELRAALDYHLRGALNVAALQCDFEPTLLTTSNYNAMLAHHKAELAGAFTTVANYFKRINGPVQGQKLFDQYGTRTYSGYSTVQAQTGFCQIAGKVGREAIFAPKGQLYTVAEKYMGELRKSLVVQADRFYPDPAYGFRPTLPPLDPKCWKKGVMLPACATQWEAERAKAE